MPRPLARVLRVLLCTAATLILLWAALIKGPMVLTRVRMSRLLADFHSIYPMQSTWSDAKRIMTKWQHWGYAKGPCTSTHCDYTIEIADPISRRMNRWLETLGSDRFYRLSRIVARLGGRGCVFSVQIVVQDGRIARTRTAFMAEVFDSGPPDHFEYGLGLGSQVRPRLRISDAQLRRGQPWILGGDEQLDDHPDYKLGRPGGCEGCEIVEFSYTPAAAHTDIVRLTTYDFSCLTRLRACTQVGDFLPAGRDWHFYDGDQMGPNLSGGPSPIPCRTESRAIGRDAEVIAEVESISADRQIDDTSPDRREFELPRVRLLRVLKGEFDIKPNAILSIVPFPGSVYITPAELPEHLTPGGRFFVILDPAYRFNAPDRFSAPRCGVLDDTPANLAALQEGIAQDFTYRHAAGSGDWP